jgi:integrase
MVATGRLGRRTVNQRVSRVRSVFRWARQRGLYPPERMEDLRALSPLSPGQAGPERGQPRSRRSVPPEVVEAAARAAPPPVAAMIHLQQLTGMRPGEVVRMAAHQVDLAHSPELWAYRPPHKTEHHGLSRTILLGPKAQAILRRWWPSDGVGYLFVGRAVGRRTSGHYRVPSYRTAVARACRVAGVPVFGPNELRHAAATAAYDQDGLSTAQELLDHAHARTTEIYVHRQDKHRAARWVAAHG